MPLGNRPRWAGFGLLLFALLPGCALLQKPPAPTPSTDAVRQALYALKTWSMEGRIGAQTREDAWQANLHWEHDPAQDRLRISGPFSQGTVSIVLQKDLILINEGQGVAQLSRDPETALRERLGFNVPLASLRHWILGLPDPGQQYLPMPMGDGSISGFRQLGWTVSLDQFISVGAHSVPRKLRAQGSGVKLKIIADHWEIEG